MGNEVDMTNKTLFSEEAKKAPFLENEDNPLPDIVTVSIRAIKEIKKLALSKNVSTVMRLGLKGGGCNGFSYHFEFEEGEARKDDRLFEYDEVIVRVDPKSFVYIKGTEIDYVKSLMETGFRFRNPNVTSKCGCGESIGF